MSITFSSEKEVVPEGLINPLSPARTDVCPFCKTQAIDLFSFNGYPQGYKDAIDMHMKGYNISYDKYEIRYMKCRKCRKEFIIDWSSGFPIPLKDNMKTTMFINEFIAGM